VKRLGRRRTSYEPIRNDCGTEATDSHRAIGREGDLVQAARKLYETYGVAASTITAMTAEAGMTRYYFPDKEAITQAVLDDYVEDLVESVLVWNEFRAFGDTRGELRNYIKAFRRCIFDAEGEYRPMVHVLQELGVRDEFTTRAIRETVDCINDNVFVQYARYHKVEIDLVYEMFVANCFGLLGLVKVNPTISDDTLMKVMEQILRLDMAPLPVPEDAADDAGGITG